MPDEPPSYPPGFEPPKDINPPWYAWLIWPIALISVLAAGSLLLRGCLGWLSPGG